MQRTLSRPNMNNAPALLSGACLVLGVLLVSPANAFWGNQGSGVGAAACGDSCQTQCAPAGGECEAWQHIKNGCQTNAMWPYPYICPDRVWAKAPFDVMVNNGWRRQNLLGSHHFDSETGKLTRAGELKVHWILTQTPPSQRQVFVERSMDQSVTDQRVAMAQEFAGDIQFDGEQAIVQDTYVRSPRRPAGIVDAERNSFIESRPPAVLPAANSSTAATSN